MKHYIGHEQSKDQKILITGGCGFIGSNLARRLSDRGFNVIVYDNCSRAGVEANLKLLLAEYPETIEFVRGDIRDAVGLQYVVDRATFVFHFAGQVAVTSSVVDPFYDFEVNAMGTLRVLDAVRASAKRPPLVFTSTNKVYGNLDGVTLTEAGTQYSPVAEEYKLNGISEQALLDFHSPYGCSKGAADQYVQDYSRTYGINTTVFRMSCIYGPFQYGNEDQGWVAHFLKKSIKDEVITIYGSGKQVRDILFIDDLLNAFEFAMNHTNVVSSRAFNIGGGLNNSVSLLDVIGIIGDILGHKLRIAFDDERIGDQRYYVTNYDYFKELSGWSPRVNPLSGITALYRWLIDTQPV